MIAYFLPGEFLRVHVGRQQAVLVESKADQDPATDDIASGI
jgi:hypothetical protein